MDNFIFGGVNTLDYGIHIFDLNSDLSPISLVREIEIPGRNGALLDQNYCFENVEHRYMGVVYENAAESMRWFRNAILQNGGYQRLEDSIHPDEYYEARYLGGLEPTLTPDRTMAKFAIEFRRKPQRFLKSGEKTISISETTTIKNPTHFEAKPLIRVTGYGNLSINGKYTTIQNYSQTYIYIDCEMMDCYYGALNLNRYVQFDGNTFPVLKAGENTISYSGSISGVSIVPRWWMV